MCIRADGKEVRFGTKVPQATWSQIRFEPCPVTRIVKSSVHSKSIPVILDVTWKFKDLVAYIAVETAVLTQNMTVFNENSQIMKEERFVLEDTSTHFHMTITPGFTSHVGVDSIRDTEHPENGDLPPTMLELVSFTSQHDKVEIENEDIIDDRMFRLAARCPKWGSIRTAVFEAKCKVEQAIQTLFPHFSPDDQPHVVWNEIKFEGDTMIRQLDGKNEVELFFPGTIKWPVAALWCSEVAPVSQEEGSHDASVVRIPIEIKGPFDFRAQKKSYPQGSSLVQIAVSFLGSYGEVITMFTTQNGKGIDARSLIEQVDPDCPIHVRACALPGGAKKKMDEVSDMLGKMLVSRGVQEEDKPTRVNTIVSKIPLHELKSITHKGRTASMG